MIRGLGSTARWVSTGHGAGNTGRDWAGTAHDTAHKRRTKAYREASRYADDMLGACAPPCFVDLDAKSQCEEREIGGNVRGEREKREVSVHDRK